LSATKRDVLILVVVAVFVGAMAYFAFPLSKTNLGLDLQGGLAVLLEATKDKNSDDGEDLRTSEKLDQAINIIQERVNKLGVAEPEIQRQGQWRISIQLPGIENQEEALQIIGKTAQLEFYDVADFGTEYASAAEAYGAAGVDSEEALPAGTRLVFWPQEENGLTDQYYLVTVDPPVTGAMLNSDGIKVTSAPNSSWKVDMQFDEDGAEAFRVVTKELADTGQITGELQLLAIVLDGVVESAPSVKEEIAGGRAEITGKFSYEEAANLALVLQTGALPLEFEVISRNEIGATLGKTALTQALLAGAVGFLLIMVFMIIYYRLLGLVASIALMIYAVIFLGILNAIGVTMTLPGIAGIVLTLGMAVDANVLIFARMRDEVAAGKTIAGATNAGFRKAFRAVFDCNMTTVITAVVLFATATGGIKGFALTLGIGVILSFLTAVAVSRSMLNLLSGWRPFRSLRLLGLHVPKGKTVRMQGGGES
jgi:preprotein translocase subunit SecD